MEILEANWKIIKKLILHTSNKNLVFRITHTFVMKILLHVYWKFGLKEIIRHQYFSIEIPILQDLINSADINDYME